MLPWYSAFIAGAILLAAHSAATQEPKCGMAQFGGCRNTNELMLLAGTKQAIARFLGEEPGNFLFPRPKSTAADDAIEVLHGPPDVPVQLPGGLTLFTACRAHSCDEKGAMLFGPARTISAIEIAHFRCGAPLHCDMDNTLTIFIRDQSLRDTVVPVFVSWLNNVHSTEEQRFPGVRIAKLANVEVRVVGN